MNKWLFSIIVLFATLGAAPQVFAVGPAVTDTTQYSITTTETSATIPHDVTAGNSNNVLVVFFNSWDVHSTSATYDGAAMTRVQMGGNSCALDYFYLSAPSTGTNDLVVNFSSSDEVGITAITLKDAVQASPIEVDETNDAAAASTITTNITTLTANDLLLKNFCTDSAALASPTNGAGETTIESFDYGSTGYATISSYKEVAAASADSVTTNWTGSYNASQQVLAVRYEASGPGLDPDPSSSSATSTMDQTQQNYAMATFMFLMSMVIMIWLVRKH